MFLFSQAPGRDTVEATANLKKGMASTGTDAMDATAFQSCQFIVRFAFEMTIL